jgi:hypothetical protein
MPATNYPHTSFFYYVKGSSGSDSNDGLTPSTAFQTIEKALSFYNDGTSDLRMCLAEAGDYTITGTNFVGGTSLHIIATVADVNIVFDANANSFAFYNHHLNIYGVDASNRLTLKGDTFHFDSSDIVAHYVDFEQKFRLFGSCGRFDNCGITELYGENATVNLDETDILNTDPSITPITLINSTTKTKGEHTVANLSSTGTVPLFYVAGGQLSMESGFFSTLTNKYTYAWELHEASVILTQARYDTGALVGANIALNDASVVSAVGGDAIGDVTTEAGWSIGASSHLYKSGNSVVLSAFLTKSSSIADGNDMVTLPAGYRPVGTTYSAAASGTAGKTARVDIGIDGVVTIRDPSSSMTTAVFQIVFFAN